MTVTTTDQYRQPSTSARVAWHCQNGHKRRVRIPLHTQIYRKNILLQKANIARDMLQEHYFDRDISEELRARTKATLEEITAGQLKEHDATYEDLVHH